jgi:hypothetical protein
MIFIIGVLVGVLVVVINYACYAWLVDYLKSQVPSFVWELKHYFGILVFCIPICICILLYGLTRQLLTFSVRN